MRRLLILTSAALLPLAAADAQQLGLVGGPPLLADGTILDVVAEGRTTAVPDIATLSAGVTTQAPTAVAALADNAQRMTRVVAALKKAGIAPRDITTRSVNLSPQYRYAENQPPVVTGYQASNIVTVRFRDVAASGAILDALVGQGANQIDGPTLSLSNPDAALDQARGDAMLRAKARAALYAKAAGLSVARILSISEGSEQSAPPGPVLYARAKAVAADTPVLAGESDVTATISVRFLLK